MIARMTAQQCAELRNTDQTTDQAGRLNGCYYCYGNQLLVRCQKFLELSPSQSFQIVKDTRLCSCCLLNSDHWWKYCPERKLCEIGGCSSTHPKLLHTSELAQPTMKPEYPETKSSETRRPNVCDASSSPDALLHHRHYSSMLFKILLVTYTVSLANQSTPSLFWMTVQHW